MENKVNVEIIRIKGNSMDTIIDQVIREYPFTLYLNGHEIITLLCIPDSLQELAVGFLISEGFIDSFEEIDEMELDRDNGRIRIQGDMEDKPLRDRLRGKRTVTSGCGKGSSFWTL